MKSISMTAGVSPEKLLSFETMLRHSFLDSAIPSLSGIEMENVDSRDYPDFCDAYLGYAEIDGKPLSETDLEYVNENHGAFLNEQAHQHFI